MKICTISELQAINSRDNGEPLVTFKGVLVRKSVADKLNQVQKKLKRQLQIADGYRTPAYQESYFLKEMLVQYDPELEFNALLEKVHQFVALPSVAGHPTGGAVDMTIEGIDMGGEIADFSIPELIPTYSTLVTPEQAKWRILLHDLMVEEGFAPFYGEWWHFSYGDREWAAFYGAAESLYAQI
jgi:D-alanyl-D-alanine dipeptidase